MHTSHPLRSEVTCETYVQPHAETDICCRPALWLNCSSYCSEVGTENEGVVGREYCQMPLAWYCHPGREYSRRRLVAVWGAERAQDLWSARQVDRCSRE